MISTLIATNNEENSFKSHPDMFQLDNYLQFNQIRKPNLTNRFKISKNIILIRVHTVGKEAQQLTSFYGALKEVKRMHTNRLSLELQVQYLDNDCVRSNQMEPKDVVDWLLESHVHVLLGHFHQGISVANKLTWHVQIIENEIRRLKFHLGNPCGENVHCPILLQDKYNYLAAIKEYVLPTLKITLVEDTDFTDLVPQITVFCQNNNALEGGGIYILKIPYTTNKKYRSLRSIDEIIHGLNLLRDKYITIIPYVMLQAYLPDTVEFKIACFNGRPLYEARVGNSDRTRGDKRGFESQATRFLFAERVLKTLKTNCPFAQYSSLIRVDIFKCEYLDKMVVNELESLEARVDSKYRDQKKEYLLMQSLTVYHANQLLSNIGKHVNQNFEPIQYPKWPT